jgi:hypothetical protein
MTKREGVGGGEKKRETVARLKKKGRGVFGGSFLLENFGGTGKADAYR